MVAQVSLVTIFLASPGDVAEERAVVEAVVDELNLTFGPATNSRFRLVRWETDTAPSVSSDAQASINKQVGDDYDILVGIFWGRVGTPTPRARSGTIEEIERALERRQQHPAALDAMIYFKEEGISPSQMDVDQLRSLQELKKTLASRGVYYKTFKDSRSFETAFRVELQLTAKRILAATDTSNTSDTTRIANTPSPTTHSDLPTGYLDLEEASTLASAEMAKTLGSISETTERFTTILQAETAFIQENPNQENFRTTADKVGEHLLAYATDLRQAALLLQDQQHRAYDTMVRAITIGGEDGILRTDAASGLFDAVVTLIGTHETSMTSLSNFKNTLQSGARYTSKFVSGRQAAIDALGELLNTQAGGVRTLSTIRDHLAGLLAKQD